jgi:uncharacterized protein with von Willebrand factor type A (vWA) domain
MNTQEDGARLGRPGEDERLLHRVLNFAAFLRENGLEATTAETLDSVSCLPLVDISNRDQFYFALRAAFVKRSDDYRLFDQLFREFWKGETCENPAGRVSRAVDEMPAPIRARASLPSDAIQSLNRSGKAVPGQNGQDGRTDKAATVIYSPAEILGRKNVRSDSAGTSMPRRLVKRLSRRLATKPGRRFESSKSGVVDLRRTLRKGISSGGQLAELAQKRRKISRSDIVVLCDISGSMDTQSARMLGLLYHLCNAARAKVFAFSTQLIELNGYLRGNSLQRASKLISENVSVWSSGTKIASALGKLITLYSGYLGPSTVLIVISDGWELDNLDSLESNLKSIRRRVKDIIWLNPLADDPRYRPLAAGMSTALPFVSILTGLKTLENKHEFDRVFGKELSPII